MEEKILVICPSRSRPNELKTMIDSFVETSTMSTLRVCLDYDDPLINENIKAIAGRVPYNIDIRKSTTEIINSSYKFSSDCYKWFSVSNDDFVFKTNGWDEKLTFAIKLHGGTGIAYGNDLLAGKNIATMSVISRDIVNSLGWLQLPKLTHLFGDNVWTYIGKQAGCLYYVPTVIIEHKHVFANKMIKDETHKYTNSHKMYVIDEAEFNQWVINQSREDIQKIKDLLCKV